jgi:tRNA modification GTPase
MADTVFALATAPGRAAVAVIRLSGPEANRALTVLTGGRRTAPRVAGLRTLRLPDGPVLDKALVLWFPGPASYTGEDCAELHLHGGSAVVDGVTDALLRLGLRPADPGEFTRRAFENGKLDLSQAEAVADLVDAETDAQRRQALAQLDGELARRHAKWREALVDALAVLEAAVDFPDEDVPEAVAGEAAPIIDQVLIELAEALADGERGERVRDGFRIALIGAPNAGKSSLLNALAGRPAAIVTETPGTTRDVIEIPLNVAGFRVLLADTAGLREARDPIEAEGVRRAKAWAASAGLRLLVIDGSSRDATWREATVQARPGDLCIINKHDLPAGAASRDARAWATEHGLEVVDLSLFAAKAEGVMRRVTERVVKALSGADFPAATQARHRRDLITAQQHLTRGRRALALRAQVELAAEDVRLAARALARVNGRIDAEDVLDRVFARFCIGK